MRIYKHLTPPLAWVALSCTVASDDTPATAAVEDWRFTVNFPMAWVPDISGELDVNGVKNEIDISFSDILEDLNAGYLLLQPQRAEQYLVRLSLPGNR